MSEAAFKAHVLNILRDEFFIWTEVEGPHFSGRRLRLDAIVTPKNIATWKTPHVALGIEFKDDIRWNGGTKALTKWFAQCVDYAHTDWDGFGYLYVFACPGMIDELTGPSSSPGAWLLSRVMGQLGIGELRFDPRRGLSFYLHESHRLWSQRDGIESGRLWSLTRTFGSR